MELSSSTALLFLVQLSLQPKESKISVQVTTSYLNLSSDVNIPQYSEGTFHVRECRNGRKGRRPEEERVQKWPKGKETRRGFITIVSLRFFKTMVPFYYMGHIKLLTKIIHCHFLQLCSSPSCKSK